MPSESFLLVFCWPFVSFLPCFHPSSFYRWIPPTRTTLIWIRTLHSFVLLAQCQPDRRAGHWTPVISHCTEEPLEILFSLRRRECVGFGAALNYFVCLSFKIRTFYCSHHRLTSLLWFCSDFACVLLTFCLPFPGIFASCLLPCCFRSSLLLTAFELLFFESVLGVLCEKDSHLFHSAHIVPALSFSCPFS